MRRFVSVYVFLVLFVVPPQMAGAQLRLLGASANAALKRRLFAQDAPSPPSPDLQIPPESWLPELDLMKRLEEASRRPRPKPPLPSADSHAPPGDSEQAKALQLLTDTADRICYNIPLRGSTKTISLKLQQLSANLSALGIFGSLTYTSVRYTGVLQKDLSKTIARSTDCKLKVFAALKDKLLRVSRGNIPPLPAGVASDSSARLESLVLYELREDFQAEYSKGYAPYTWHIIVESYFSAKAAEARTRELNDKYSGLFFQQVQSNYKPNIWMVTLGSGLAKSDADFLLRVARRLPDFESPYEYCWWVGTTDPKHECK